MRTARLPTDRDAPLAVVGAGPAGVHMAARLRQLGYGDVTILEASDRIGGKTRSYNHHGTAHELGTTGFSDAPGSPLERFIDAVFPPGSGDPYFDVSITGLLKDAIVPQLPSTWFGRLGYFLRYQRCRLRFRSVYRRLRRAGFPHQLDPANQPLLDQLAGSTRAFLHRERMAFMEVALRHRFLAYGYGDLEDVPAFYGVQLIWANFVVADTYRKFHAGNDTLWTRAVEHFGLHVELKTPVVRCDPSDFDSSGRVRVTSRRDGEIQEREFAAVFLSVPFRVADGLPEEDRELFTDPLTYSYVLSLVRLPDLEAPRTVQYPTTATDSDGYEVSLLFSMSRAEQLLLGKDSDPKVCTAHQLETRQDRPTHADLASVQASLLDQLASRYGHARAEVVHPHEWPTYFPRIRGEHIRSGALARLQRRQGHAGIWYIGSCVAGELVSLVTHHNEHLLATHGPQALAAQR